MKFLVAFAAIAVTAVTAQTPQGAQASQVCDADYIVTRCLQTESDKPKKCDPTDFDCLCYAYQAIATCYNNCPNDTRAPSARSAAENNCKNASMYGTKAQASKTATPGSSDSTTLAVASGAPTTTANLNGQSTGTPTNSDDGFSAGSPTSTNAAVSLNAGGVVFAGLAGIFAAFF